MRDSEGAAVWASARPSRIPPSSTEPPSTRRERSTLRRVDDVMGPPADKSLKEYMERWRQGQPKRREWPFLDTPTGGRLGCRGEGCTGDGIDRRTGAAPDPGPRVPPLRPP